MALTIVDRFRPRRRKILQIASDTNELYLSSELALFSPEQMRPLAFLSLILLLTGGIFFSGLNMLTYIWRTGHYPSVSAGQIFLWFVLNLLSYVVILPIHELVHGAAFKFWGGKPYYGAKWPIALYCSAKEQVFPRNYYLVIGLAPLLIITTVAIILTLLAPNWSAYALFATIGNFSGAAGDLWVAWRLRAVPSSALIEDRETGYRVWEIAQNTMETL